MMISSERVLLREFVESDWEAVLAYQSDPVFLHYYPWTHRTPSDVQSFLQAFIDQQLQRPRHRFQFAVTLRTEGKLIGNCGIRKSTPGAREADIGFALNPKCWGRGYAKESAGLLLAFGFQELKVYRIWARCLAENRSSAHVLERLGMHLEGKLRENEWFKGRWWDTLLYGILEDEWRHHQAPSPLRETRRRV